MAEALDATDLQILKTLQKNAKLTTKELADAVHLTPTPVFERQKRLERQGYIKKLIRGDICGNDEALSIDSIRLMILPVVLKYGIERATLFGSYARGEAKEDSDVDFLIECNGIDTMTEYLSLTDDLKTAIGKNVDIVMYDALQTDRSRAAKRLRQNIEKDKVIVYEKI